MATHSSVLAWRIPGTGQPGRLQSMGSRRVRHDWSDLAAAAAAAFLKGNSISLKKHLLIKIWMSALSPFPFFLLKPSSNSRIPQLTVLSWSATTMLTWQPASLFLGNFFSWYPRSCLRLKPSPEIQCGNLPLSAMIRLYVKHWSKCQTKETKIPSLTEDDCLTQLTSVCPPNSSLLCYIYSGTWTIPLIFRLVANC